MYDEGDDEADDAHLWPGTEVKIESDDKMKTVSLILCKNG